jgi:hypothetical protein
VLRGHCYRAIAGVCAACVGAVGAAVLTHAVALRSCFKNPGLVVSPNLSRTLKLPNSGKVTH